MEPTAVVSDSWTPDSDLTLAPTLTFNSSAKTIIAKAARFSASAGNKITGGYTEVTAGGGITLYIDPSWYTPAQITGEAIGTGDGTTTAFATDFIVASAGTVYVDGVAQSGVTMQTNLPVSDLCSFWNVVRPYDTNGKLRYIDSSAQVPIPVGSPTIIDNSQYSKIGISVLSFLSSSSLSKVKIETSSDKLNWDVVSSSAPVDYSQTSYTVPAAYRYNRYFKITALDTLDHSITILSQGSQFAAAQGYDLSKNIIFSSAPPSGAVITADYTPGTIAKDANHVFDFTMTIQLGEYTS